MKQVETIFRAAAILRHMHVLIEGQVLFYLFKVLVLLHALDLKKHN